MRRYKNLVFTFYKTKIQVKLKVNSIINYFVFIRLLFNKSILIRLIKCQLIIEYMNKLLFKINYFTSKLF